MRMVSTSSNGMADRQGYDYSRMESEVAREATNAAKRIRDKVKRSLEDIIAVGAELLHIKALLLHGEFIPWLKAEFGWAERTARNLMAVAERFGKAEMISDLRIQPTAAYLLAAPSAPDEARQAAVARAAAGELITPVLARQLLASSRKRLQGRKTATENCGAEDRLIKMLKLYRMKWDHARLPEMARCLREFAADLDKRASKPSGRSNRGQLNSGN